MCEQVCNKIHEEVLKQAFIDSVISVGKAVKAA
jgi:hypothetical protein